MKKFNLKNQLQFSSYLSDSRLLYFILTIFLLLPNAVDSSNSKDEFLFTQPYYESWAMEFSTNMYSIITSNKMIGMWLNPKTEGVQFSVVPDSKFVIIRKEVVGNFNFIRMEIRVNEMADQMDNTTWTIKATSFDLLKQTTCLIHVHVHDRNNLSPHFKKDEYRFELPENSPVGTTITTMEAYDRDREFRNRFFYYALAHDTNNFAIHPTSGRVVLSTPISYRVQSDHSVDIYAIDRGSGKNATTNLKVTILPVNKYKPSILVKKLAYSDTSTNQTLAVLECSDLDIGSNGKIQTPQITNDEALEFIKLLPGSTQGSFLINLRKHPTSLLNLPVIVSLADQGSPPLVTVKSFPLLLPVENAYIPIFNSSDPIRFRISEWSEPGTLIGSISAWIPFRSQVGWKIIEDEGIFEISKTSGLLWLKQPVDRETKDRYQLEVQAYNLDAVGHTSYHSNINVEIEIEDANDNDPQFVGLPYHVILSEDDSDLGVIFQVHAEDVDLGINGSVTYELVDDDGVPLTINHITGQISVSGPLDSDQRQAGRFFVRVRAQDSGLPYARSSDVIIVVEIRNINDNPPRFGVHYCDVTCPMSLVDEDLILVSLNPFDVDPVPGQRMSCGLLRENDFRFFRIRSGSCSLKINPRFRSHLEESRIFNVSIIASDSQLESNPLPVIIRFTGSQLKQKCPENNLQKQVQQVMGNPELTLRYNDVIMNTSSLPNRHQPEVFRKNQLQHVHVSESLSVDSEVFQVNIRDTDTQYNGLLWMTINNDQTNFKIDPLTGQVRLLQPLDRELQSTYQITVHVTDLGSKLRRLSNHVTIDVIVDDVNDNSPTFDADVYNFEIFENATNDVICGDVSADDADEGFNAKLKFWIHEADLKIIDYKFKIDPENGKIKLNGSLDRENRSSYR